MHDSTITPRLQRKYSFAIKCKNQVGKRVALLVRIIIKMSPADHNISTSSCIKRFNLALIFSFAFYSVQTHAAHAMH